MALRTETIIIIAMAISSPFVGQADGLGSETAKSNAEKRHVIDAAVEPWNAVNGWLIEYEALPAELPTVRIHQTMAVSSPGELYKIKAHTTAGIPWQEDPFCQEYFIIRAERV